MKLAPVISYFGSKFSLAGKYDPPQYDTIIEPFAGGAGYSLNYAHKKVILVEKYDVLCGVWDYLIRVSPSELLSLPDVPRPTTLDDYKWPCREARDLAGFWNAQALVTPRRVSSPWNDDGRKRGAVSVWGPKCRQRLARVVPHIRHWKLIRGTYRDAPDIPATWYIDPPYQDKGKSYVCSAKSIDFKDLGSWCRSREGQVQVCENAGADWLPFKRAFTLRKGLTESSHEVVWKNY